MTSQSPGPHLFFNSRISRSNSDLDTKVVDETDLRKLKETRIVDGEDYAWWRQNLVLQFDEKGDMKGSSVRSMSLKRGGLI